LPSRAEGPSHSSGCRWGVPMKRREFIAGLAGVATTPAVDARAQTLRKIPRVGLVMGGNPAAGGRYVEAFRQGLRALGHVEGQTVALEVRWPEGRVERYPGLVAELIGLKVDVLVVVDSQAALAAKSATQTIPIVLVSGDPIGFGLAQSLARPGGNVTGVSFLTVEIAGKRLQMLNEMVPGLARVAVLRDANFTAHARLVEATEAAARKLKVEVQIVAARGPEDLEVSLAAAVHGKAQGLVVLESPLTLTNRAQIVALAAKSRLPDMYGVREFADAGGLMAYGASLVAILRYLATFVDKILKGAKPADLPIEQSTKLELVINAKTAKALGLTIAPALLAFADEVIE
jgi:putative tryptophan/tyrosine transport system substrate-binding protein